MHRYRQVLLSLAGILCVFQLAMAQTVTVNSITIYGLKRTRAPIVYRELTFKKGDELPQEELGDIMERNQNNLLNLGIFNEALVNVSDWDTENHKVDIVIEVTESWYIYALPILELADRNFNVWWTTYHHELDRLNLGGRLDFLNFTGRNDKLKAKLQFGYTPKQELEYRFPYLNRQQSLGISIGFLHSINNEISYATIDNQEEFIQIDERKLLDRWKLNTNAVYRPNLFVQYELSLTYQRYSVDQQIVADYNPIYFRNGKTRSSTLITRLAYRYDDRDFKIYPSKGISTQLELEKTGIGASHDENSLTSRLAVEWNKSLTSRLQQRLVGIAHYSISRNRPSYLYYHGLGYGQNYIRGYELYVVDALDYFIGKYQLAFRLVNTKFNWGRAIPVSQFREMPIRVYLSLAAETGRTYDPYTFQENGLSNQWLYGGGPGLDIVLYNNFLLQLNFSTNHLGEWGFYFHNKTSF